MKLVHISWPDADDLLSNGLEFDNEVEGPWPLGRRACLQVRPIGIDMGSVFQRKCDSFTSMQPILRVMQNLKFVDCS